VELYSSANKQIKTKEIKLSGVHLFSFLCISVFVKAPFFSLSLLGKRCSGGGGGEGGNEVST
jgi:hypothetical protein